MEVAWESERVKVRLKGLKGVGVIEGGNCAIKLEKDSKASIETISWSVLSIEYWGEKGNREKHVAKREDYGIMAPLGLITQFSKWTSR